MFSPKANLLYKDQNNCFYEAGHVWTVERSGFADASKTYYSYYYDWGITLSGRLLAIVSLETTYFYLGKTIKVNQSRIYNVSYNFDVLYVEDYDIWYNSGHCVVINYKEPYFGIHIEEEDLHLYGK